MVDSKEVINNAVNALQLGETLLYPTDTIWGIGCDATNRDAVEKIYSIKHRDHSKSMLILCADIAMVEHYVGGIGERAREILLSPDRPTTLILPNAKNMLADNLPAADGTIGVRIPQMDFCLSLLRSFGRPVVSTSANFSGSPSPASFADISPELVDCVDMCIPALFESHKGTSSSRIVKLSPDGKITVLRS